MYIYVLQMYTDTKPLRIGFFTDNGMLRPVPAMERGVDVARELLAGKGHEVKIELISL